ncbi:MULTISPECIES: NADH:flavin oxidoreductase/NADH oxidase [Arthrobacter]|uniref:NADH:flavin oxidoreductase/NADH oxidase n=1 Tax=Arthrobacter terricola TaxID=2547396 RepID=A0A4R5KAV7_9MICC|nr:MULTISPECIES: NADH:flavin oxidoreductase/NADH oxidase [Arthrobacter]MBT8163173.1 NADH:flavin oxidoreductase/NADH oxidase [Arthrobacter sp. GN70]TDF91257.1 NADH:flavin oxidoreductase/NADH oxidase [Arthrobacter terricola]
MTTSPLFQPLTVRSTTIRNRIWVSPMCQYSCENQDGVPNDWHLMHLGQFAAGGAGLVMAEATGVNPIGRISSEDTGMWNDQQRDAWARIVRLIHEQGATAAIQLAHAGRKASDYRLFDERCGTTKPFAEGGWKTVAPSSLAFPGFDVPRELDHAGIDEVVQDFAAAARRSVEAGFDIIEIHAAHGYLIHEFLSPLSNTRTDEYGGSLENRARLLLRIVAAVREAIGNDHGLFVRFSATDWAEGGWDQEQTAVVAAMARDRGADVFDISTGGLIDGVEIPVGEGYQVPLADHIKSASEVPTSAVGLITTAKYAEEVVASGRADAVMLGREMLRDPHFALRAARELNVHVDYWPRQYKAVQWKVRETAGR